MQSVQYPGVRAALNIITIAVVAAVGAWLMFFAVTTLIAPHPIEYREGAAQVVTQLLLAGRNPFIPENQPLGMTNYGIVFSLAVWPLAALFGNTLLVHRAVTVLFLVLSTYVVARTALASNQQAAVSLAGAELVAAALAARGGLGGYPTSMGAFFFLVAIALPYQRNFDRWGLLLSGAASLLALYTKPYFVLGFGIVATYTFLFVSSKRGLIYTIGFAAVTSLSVLVVRSVLPLYFFDTVFSNLAQTVETDPTHLSSQLRQLAVEFMPLLLGGLLMLLAGLRERTREASSTVRRFTWGDLLAAEQGVFRGRIDYYFYASLCAMLAFVLILGPHPMNYMTYTYQLVVPVGVLWLLVSLRSQQKLTLVVIPLLLINLVMFSLTRLGFERLRQSTQSEAAWNALSTYANECKQPLNSPIVVPEMIRRDLWTIDSGHTEYFFYQKPYPGMAWFGAGYDIVADLGSRYMNTVRGLVAHQDFDCILLARYSAWPRNLPLDRGHYHLADSIVISMPQTDQSWQIDIWLPSKE